MYKQLFTLSAFTIFFVACSTNNNNNSSSVANDTTDAPVETKSPNTDYKPAFAGQTRIKGVHTSTPYEGKMINSDLKKP